MPAMSFRPDVAEIPPRPLWDWVGMTHGQWANMGPILGLTGRGTLLTPSPPNWIFRCSVLGSRLPLLPDGYFGPSTFGLIATARPPFQSPAVPCIDAPRSSPAPPQHPFCRTGGTGGTLGGIGGTQWLASPHTPTHSGAETTTHPPCLLDRVGAFPPASVQPYEKPPHPTWIELASNSLLFNQTTPAPVAAQVMLLLLLLLAAACCAHLVTGDFAD
ncbi:hypothetical protein ACO22_07477 [Paracoccidioides brasiliensis]|uniref:Uncharacterized protein n=1 Tax=Paracoccidioides brasiliensis TaxID=121759 RepID=A0A1D2J4J6_PARBR|nr:hypothetical protein ACO22_07477 [Paracoccidioides brasiliensis]